MGARLSLLLIQEPSKWLLLFWRSFELAFFILSLVVSTIVLKEEISEADESESVHYFYPIVFGFSFFDALISLCDNIVYWKELCQGRISRSKKGSHSIDTKPSKEQSLEENRPPSFGFQEKTK
eukprot:m.110349 g.110349  ORF g.110349 m.110349 type:complete len:123 (+) comp37388_c0_seq4:1541-1909(+)